MFGATVVIVEEHILGVAALASRLNVRCRICGIMLLGGQQRGASTSDGD
jgi:hypothetical protein